MCDVLFQVVCVVELNIMKHMAAYITRLAKEFPIIQGFNISVDNLNYLLERTGIQGIGLQGGEEIKPGYKNFDGLAEILETLEVD